MTLKYRFSYSLEVCRLYVFCTSFTVLRNSYCCLKKYFLLLSLNSHQIINLKVVKGQFLLYNQKIDTTRGTLFKIGLGGKRVSKTSY